RRCVWNGWMGLRACAAEDRTRPRIPGSPGIRLAVETQGSGGPACSAHVRAALAGYPPDRDDLRHDAGVVSGVRRDRRFAAVSALPVWCAAAASADHRDLSMHRHGPPTSLEHSIVEHLGGAVVRQPHCRTDVARIARWTWLAGRDTTLPPVALQSRAS